MYNETLGLVNITVRVYVARVAILLAFLSAQVNASDLFGGYSEKLEQINRDASYPRTEQSAIDALRSIPESTAIEFSKYAYVRYLKSQSQSDYTGILHIIKPSSLSSVVEDVMLSGSYGYDYLDHEFYFANTAGVEFSNPTEVRNNVIKNVHNQCELVVWNAIFLAKQGSQYYTIDTECSELPSLSSDHTPPTSELLNIYYKFRDIDGY